MSKSQSEGEYFARIEVEKKRKLAEQQLQGVLPRRQVDGDLGLAAAEMNVMVVGGKVEVGLLGAVRPFAEGRAIDQEMVVAGAFLFDAGGRHAHASEAEHHGDRVGDRLSILRGANIGLGTLRGPGRPGGRWSRSRRRTQRSRDAGCRAVQLPGRRRDGRFRG